ncbi:MAG: hypothetical protein ACREQE_04645 [Candidatus Binataceae bacterium]
MAVALLGAYHGVDPSMGWLFAVGLGLQEHRRSKVVKSLVPIAIGHLISIAFVVALIGGLMASAAGWLRPAGAGLLVLFGLFRFLRPRAHPRWVAMRVNARELATWSFLMATAHGAGLMLLPILLDLPADGAMAMHHKMTGMAGHAAFLSYRAIGVWPAAAVVLLHTLTLFVVMGIVAMVVYEWVGLKILRSAWVNLDTLWAGALVGAGMLSLVI